MLKRTASLIIAAAFLLLALTGCASRDSESCSDGVVSNAPVDVPGALYGAVTACPIQTGEEGYSPTTLPTEDTVPEPTPEPGPELTEPAANPTEEPIRDIETADAYVNANGVAFRGGPSREAEKLERLTEGTKIKVNGENSEWYRVIKGDVTGYIANKYVTLGAYSTPAPTPVPANYIRDIGPEKAYVNSNGVNVREKPDRSSKKLAKLYKGHKLTVTGENDEWYRVEFDGTEGYIVKEFVTFGTYSTPKPTATPKPTKTPKPTAKPTPTPKPTKTPKPTATPTPKPTKTPKPTATPTPAPSYYHISPGQFSDEDVYVLAQFLHIETRYNSVAGQRAVASVVLNRVLNESHHFPNTVPEVIFQHNQFVPESALEGVVPNAEVLASARYVLQEHGPTLPKKVLFYRASYLGTSWYSYMTYYCTIDDNNFFIAISNGY